MKLSEPVSRLREFNSQAAIFCSELDEEKHTTMARQSWTAGAVCCVTGMIALVAVGCGGGGPERPAKAPVSGNVTLDDKPASGAIVQFVSSVGGAAQAPVDDQGNYTVDGGVEVGVQKVVIIPAPAEMGGAPEDPTNPTGSYTPPIVIPSKYHTAATSGFEVTVEEKPAGETNKFDFKMTSGG